MDSYNISLSSPPCEDGALENRSSSRQVREPVTTEIAPSQVENRHDDVSLTFDQ